MSAREQLEQLDAIARAAHAEVVAQCTGEKRWTMSIPARPDYDSDLLIDPANEAVHKPTAAVRAVLDLARDLDREWGTVHDPRNPRQIGDDIRAAIAEALDHP